MWQNVYGNADIEYLRDFLCLHFFEENDYDETVFRDFCRQCLCYALKAVSYLLIISFLYLINRLRDCCCKFEKVSNDSCIQSLKKHYFDYQDICYGCVGNCKMFYLRLV